MKNHGLGSETNRRGSVKNVSFENREKKEKEIRTGSKSYISHFPSKDKYGNKVGLVTIKK